MVEEKKKMGSKSFADVNKKVLEKVLIKDCEEGIINSNGGDYVQTQIGVESFEDLINSGIYFVDKTFMIKDLIDISNKVTLFPRPRRFGKTLTLSMINNFFNIAKDSKNLFEGLNISKCGDKYLSKMNKYPVISFSLKDFGENNFNDMISYLKNILKRVYKPYRFLLNSLDVYDQKYFNSILSGEIEVADLKFAIYNLTEYLYYYYNEKVIVLIDEYDTLMQTAYSKKYFEEASLFMQSFYGSALKTNEFLEFGILTGILRASKESLFSKLNNVTTYGATSKKFNQYFGFTHKEVMDALVAADMTDQEEDVKRWYDGYNFGGMQIYNPWSINNFLDSEKVFLPYWVNTGASTILYDLFDESFRGVLYDLIFGKTVKAVLNEDITFSALDKSKDNLLNFCYMTGYLTIEKTELIDNKIMASFKVPNDEIKTVFTTLVERMLFKSTVAAPLSDFNKALLESDEEKMKEALDKILLDSVSFNDYRETFYHGLVLGIVNGLGSNYIIKSNRESGLGRYDISIMNRDFDFGVIFEFKVGDDEELDALALTALEQIEDKAYYNDFLELNVKNINVYGIAFNKKNVVIKKM